MDLEAEPLTQDYQRLKMEDEKIIKVLVLGESESGKTTFCNQQCLIPHLPSEKHKKVKKTKGCQMHLQQHIPQMENLITDQHIREFVTPKSQYIQNKYLIQYFDLAGDKRQRNFLQLYTRQQLHEFQTILYFFDLTNLKTLYNFYSWVQNLFQNKSSQMNYGCLWEIPFLIIGTKRDQISDRNFMQIKSNVKKYLNNVFQCNSGDNILFLSSLDDSKKSKKSNQIEFQIFNLFLSELCIEYQLKIEQRKRLHQQTKGNVLLNRSEYIKNSEIEGLLKNSKKFCLNPDFYLNKYMIYDNSTLWEDFKFGVLQKFQQVREKINIMKFLRQIVKNRKRSNSNNNNNAKGDQFQLSHTI